MLGDSYALLALILGATLALGGLFFGTLNVVSVGFAAILLGLAVDYGLVLYQESLCAPHLTARELGRTLAPDILWSAVTTGSAPGPASCAPQRAQNRLSPGF